jgi:5-methylcytosine-specific restriction protein A
MIKRAKRLGSTAPQRGNSTQRGYDRRWRNARRDFLRAHPQCAECIKEERYIAATVVDHITPHRGNQLLFWDVSNWQPLCKPCHDLKTLSGR